MYMREAGDMIEQTFPLIFAIGCDAHLLDLYAEDLGKVEEQTQTRRGCLLQHGVDAQGNRGCASAVPGENRGVAHVSYLPGNSVRMC